MTSVLQILHAVAGLIVLAEALNKLERTSLFTPRRRTYDRLADCLKVTAWALMALGAAGAVAAPMMLQLGIEPNQANELMRLERPTLAETVVLLGFAVLIVRTRVKEG